MPKDHPKSLQECNENMYDDVEVASLKKTILEKVFINSTSHFSLTSHLGNVLILPISCLNEHEKNFWVSSKLSLKRQPTTDSSLDK